MTHRSRVSRHATVAPSARLPFHLERPRTFYRSNLPRFETARSSTRTFPAARPSLSTRALQGTVIVIAGGAKVLTSWRCARTYTTAGAVVVSVDALAYLATTRLAAGAAPPSNRADVRQGWRAIDLPLFVVAAGAWNSCDGDIGNQYTGDNCSRRTHDTANKRAAPFNRLHHL